MKTEIDSPVIGRVRELVLPIASDLGLDVYDVEQRGGVLRITLDTPAGVESGVTLDDLALASRLMSKELDQHDPIPYRYTLEVTSPGVERSLRTPEHFRREVGKVVTVRLANVEAEQRRLQGEIVAATDDAVTIRTDDGERSIAYAEIDRAKTVFEWGAAPKPGRAKKQTSNAGEPRRSGAKTRFGTAAAPAASPAASDKEHS